MVTHPSWCSRCRLRSPAAQALAATWFRDYGQSCISPSRFYVHEGSYYWFSKTFADVARRLRLVQYFKDCVQVRPLANIRGLRIAKSLVKDALGRGAELIARRGRANEFNCGYHLEPSVLGRVPDYARVMKEEPFSRVAPDATFRDYKEVMRRANALPFGLAGYPFSNDMRTATMVAEDLEVGMVGVIDLFLAAAEAPFGGIRESGMGREGGSLVLPDYVERDYVNLKLEEVD